MMQTVSKVTDEICFFQTSWLYLVNQLNIQS